MSKRPKFQCDLTSPNRLFTLTNSPARSGTGDFGQIAQLVEQRTENPRVGGSTPSLATIKINEKAAEMAAFWFMRTVRKQRSSGHCFQNVFDILLGCVRIYKTESRYGFIVLTDFTMRGSYERKAGLVIAICPRAVLFR